MTAHSVFVIGDSISIQYGPHLQDALDGACSYDRKRDDGGSPRSLHNLDVPTGANAGDSDMVLSYVRQRRRVAPIMAGLTLFNCGLHDIKTIAGRRQVEPGRYAANLARIIAELHAMGTMPVWLTTTPVDDAIHAARQTAFRRTAADVALYNRLATEVMAATSVATIDLHAFCLPLVPQGFCDHVHYIEPVRAAQGGFLASAVRHLLAQLDADRQPSPEPHG